MKTQKDGPMKTWESSALLPPDPRVMPLNRLTLAFTKEAAPLEAVFQSYFINNNLSHVRLALFLGALMYGLFGILDALLMPEQKTIAWLIRFGFVCPVILAVLAATFSARMRPFLQPLISFVFAICGLGIVLMIIVAPAPISYYYHAGLILIFIFGYSFIFLRFLYASISGALIFIFYQIAAALINMPALEIIISSFFLISGNIAGMLVCYTSEFTNRRNFFLMHLLEAKESKIREANELLERRVAERTASLEKLNRELAKEIEERHLAEQERTRLEMQLKQAERMEVIGKLTAGVAHDLNNILSGLVTYPDLLLMDIPKESRLHGSIQLIRQSGEKAAAIVQDLLSLARQGMAEKKLINLNDVINDYLLSPAYKLLAGRNSRIVMKKELREDLLNIEGSPAHLSKILMNLLHNAYEAIMVEGGVRLSTDNCYLDQPREAYERIPAGGYVVLSIEDTGIGIREEDVPRIFEPFYSKKKLGRSGTGLGMTLVWSAVKEHGGFMDVRTKEGQGTTFELYFPVAQGERVHRDEPASVEDCLGNEKILVVDDMPEQREIAAAILGKLGYQVHSVDSGEAAIDYLKNTKADILILDMIMEPGIDGCETYRRILEMHPRQKAIVASGFSESERVREAQRLGAGQYLKKPYSLEKIGKAVRSELDRKAQEQL